MILISNIVALTTVLSLFSFGKADLPVIKKNEAYYCNRMCEDLGGESEVVLPDMTRADCVTRKYAYECDWAAKWSECLGQSMFYAAILNKKPVCTLIVREGDHRFVHRARVVGDEYDVEIEIIEIEL